jgi:transcriptional regulator with XRE-family HTH domain
MPSRKVVNSLDPLRQAVRGGVEESSLRQVARDVGMAHTSLSDFLSGRTPRASTVTKIRRWFEGDDNEVLRLRQEVAELRKRVAELERQLREAKR